MNVPDNLKYYKEHDWVRVESDGTAVVGITEFAAESLGDIVFVELPEPGTEIKQFDKLGEIESVKAVSDLYTPIGGRVIESNQAVTEAPETVNDSPYDAGWLIKIELSDAGEMDNLLSAAEYETLLAAEG
jgi:glycine cleavage system H protein